MGNSLEQRFLRFLDDLNGGENIDALGLREGNRADFLFWERAVVLEVKSLEADTRHKLEKMLGEARGDGPFPLHVGRLPLKEAVKGLPGAEDVALRSSTQ